MQRRYMQLGTPQQQLLLYPWIKWIRSRRKQVSKNDVAGAVKGGAVA